MSLDAAAYQLVFDASPLPMLVADRETMRFLAVNDAACKHYGWTRDELLELTLRDIRPPEDVPGFELLFRGSKNPRYTRTSRHRRKDGRILDVTLHLSRVMVAGREATLLVVHDLSGVAEAERRFQLLVEKSVEGISMTSADGAVVYMSPGGQRMLGYEHGELIGKPSYSKTHPDDMASFPEPGATRHVVARVMHRDGTWRWIESSTTNLTHDPAVRGFVSNYRDVTARKQAEEALVASEANFRTLIERIPLAMLVFRGGQIVYVNPAAVAMLGYRDASEIVGRPILDFIHPDEREQVTQRMAQAEATGGTPHGVGRMLRSDGSTIFVEGRGMRLDFDGQPSTVAVASDVTERHAVLARMALADRMLSVGTLAAGVAHEINNPLAYISSNLEVLQSELPNVQLSGASRLDAATLAELVSDALEGVSRVSKIVGNLRSLARPGHESRGPVDVLEVLATAIKMSHNELRHRARLVQDHEPDLPLVEADASRLGQVLLNLLLNAAQAIPEGRAEHNEIRVAARRGGDGRRIHVAIRDTGAGIAPAHLQRIFDPFFTTKPQGGGVGLGLSISHQLVHAMGGEILVESVQGQGSTFTVTLPIAASQRETASPGRELPAQHGVRALLVDDEESVGRALALLLAPETEVIAVTRADEALARIRRGERYDVILCDLMMPDVGGVELYERLATSSPEHASRIVFMTGGAFTPQTREFLDRLGSPYLAKPFSEVQLRLAIQRVLDAHGPMP